MVRRPIHSILVLSLAILSFSNCEAAELKDLQGTWTGTWHSEINEHRGPLKARFTTKGEDKVEARFTGRFFKIVPFKFIVTLDVVSVTDGVIKLKGKQDLGRTLGTYHYDVTFKDGHFLANYHTDKDKGVFEVKRN